MGRKKKNYDKPVEEQPKVKDNLLEFGDLETEAIISGDNELTITESNNFVVDSEAIIPEEVTEEMKLEESISTSETAVKVSDVVVKTTMEDYEKIFNEEYFNNLKEKGCDYTAYGKWQEAYCGVFQRAFNLRNKTILDVGSAYGSISFGFKMQGVMSVAVDVAKCLVGKTFRGIRFVNAMAQHMPDIDNKTIDFIHCSYVLNYIPKNELVDTFKEFKRVITDHGKILVIFNKGNDNVSGINHMHTNETVINAAIEANLKLFECKEILKHYDDPEYRFIQSYDWNILCFE